MNICFKSENPTVAYAAEELAKYVKLVSEIDSEISADTLCGDGIRLGLLSDLSLPSDDLHDSFIEDIIDIDVNELKGYIAGSNARSILMGVYIYLKSVGCRWVRPGDDGEYLPNADLSKHSFRYRKKADKPFRGECCEGSISYEHMRDTVYWMPKVGMNMYMIEGIVPYTYMHKWYGHIGNTKLRQKGQVTDYDFLEEKIALLEKDIIKTGLQFHAVGHGWMFNGFNIKRGKNSKSSDIMTPEQKQLLAMVNGKRDLMHGDTFYTHFCYSNPDARRFLVDFWVRYAKEKPYIDYFHVWLADAINNQCECDECIKKEPSDHYVTLLNEIDEALTANGIDSRLVFILYTDTLRPPKTERLKNPDRFLLLSACGGEYRKGYVNEEFTGVEPPFVRNQWHAPGKALGDKWRADWKKACDGNLLSCVFEYRFYTDQYCDPGYMQIARETFRDMKALGSVGFDGCMSDQTHRCYLPTALPIILLGEAEFDSGLDFEEFTNDYFSSAFGKDGALCREYLEKLSTLFCPNYIRNNPPRAGIEEDGILPPPDLTAESWFNNPSYIDSLDRIPELIENFKPIIERNKTLKDSCHARSWEYLSYHTDIAQRLAEIYRKGASGDKKGAQELYLALNDWISGFELEIHNVFDLCLFDRYMRGKLDLPAQNYYD